MPIDYSLALLFCLLRSVVPILNEMDQEWYDTTQCRVPCAGDWGYRDRVAVVVVVIVVSVF